MKKHTIGCWVAIGVVIIVLVVSGRYLFSRNERTILTDTLVQQISSSGDTKDLTAEPLRLEAEGVVKDTGNNDILFIDHKFYTNSTQIEVKPYAMEDSDVIKVFV